MPTEIYHITHIDNLPSILKQGCLLANSQLQQINIQYQDVAHGQIQDVRARKPVNCCVGGTLHDYVPFYFSPRSPMLYAIHTGSVAQYQGGQQKMLHFVTSVEAIAAQNLDFAFTDGHATKAFTRFYDSLADLPEAIDWAVVRSWSWKDTNDDMDRKRRKQAEFLVHRTVPWSLIDSIGVINSTIRQEVQKILGNNVHAPRIKIVPDWYYQ